MPKFEGEISVNGNTYKIKGEFTSADSTQAPADLEKLKRLRLEAVERYREKIRGKGGPSLEEGIAAQKRFHADFEAQIKADMGLKPRP